MRSAALPRFATGSLEHAMAALSGPELEAMHDPAGDAHEHDDADLHPDRDAAPAPRLRREQHERGMVAGERALRRATDETVITAPLARSEHETAAAAGGATRRPRRA